MKIIKKHFSQNFNTSDRSTQFPVPVITQAMTNVSKLAVTLQVMVFNIDLLICDAIFHL
jgi:hypothetical protein